MKLLAFLLAAPLLLVQDGAGPLIHSMDDLQVRLPAKNGHAETVDGKIGKAVKFSFDKDCSGDFCATPIRGNAEWDKAAGFSFWLKGDGSKNFG
ncbi:MAG TPA: hypothetical protein VG457_06420, partial [Planctomycetota bacterium]|nr:hypothetical protein [Planctomycetota bacterium]